ncbi:hypothetical protein ACFFRR_006554 [Megaselia abdita]
MIAPLLFLSVLAVSHIASVFPEEDEKLVSFTLLHNNDLHARFEQISATLGSCTKNLEDKNECYGGFARAVHLVREFRKETGNSLLYLYAGDTFTGTEWFTEFKGEICSRFMNLLSPDAMSLGNHEFDDDGLNGLARYVSDVNTTTLAANLEFPVNINVRASNVFLINGIKIGVIGVLTPETKSLSPGLTGSVVFNDEIGVINRESKKLKNQGVEIIIALTHSGYDKDKEIASKCPEVDIVVGGHSHSFLSNGTIDRKHPETESIQGPYPTIITRADGKSVVVVQAYAFSKYMGKLDLTFTKSGHLVQATGSPILLDHSVPQDQDVLDLLEDYRKRLPNKEVIGYSNVQMDGINECKKGECNLGNLIMDAIVYDRVKSISENRDYPYFTDATIAFINAGGIRSSIDKKPGGAITKTDVVLVLPFKDRYKLVKIRGNTIRKALEHSAFEYDRNNAEGGILQMAGVRVEFNVSRPVGAQVVKVLVLCAECDIPKYYPLDDTKLYNILVSDYLLGGGGGYVFTEDGMSAPVDLEKYDAEYVIEYIRERRIIYPMLEGRIVFL